MAKNWQYGRLRAVALQVVMWLIFGASLGLAAFIDHRRSGGLDVQLGPPMTDGRLVVRLPVGWDLLMKQKGEAAVPSRRTLTLIDFDRQGRERRKLRIIQEQQQGGRVRGPEYYLESMVTIPSDEDAGMPLEPFPFLSQSDGVLVPVKVNTKMLRRMLPGADLPEAGIYACVVMPDGLTVTLQVTGDGAYGPSNRALLRQVADSIRLADNVSATGPAR